MSSHSILLSWKSLPLEQQNGRIIYYHVIIAETQVLFLENGTVISTVGDDIDMTYNVTGNNAKLINMLHPSYNYTVRIAAVTSAGIGSFSVPMTATTLEDGVLCVFVLAMLATYFCSVYVVR